MSAPWRSTRVSRSRSRDWRDHGDLYWSNIDRTARRLALMRPAAEKACEARPDLPEAHLALGMYYYRGLRDYDRALAESGRTAATTG